MSRMYKTMDILFVLLVLLGGVYTFIAVSLWVWLTETTLVAGLIMVTTAPAVSCVLYGVTAAALGEGWK